MFRVLGISLIILAIALGTVPHFTDCQSQGLFATLANGTKTPMKCHWTAVAESATAIPLFVVGGIMAITKYRQNYMFLSILGLVLTGVAISLPTFAIGVCPTPSHICNTLMKPAIIGISTIIGLVSMAGIVLSIRKRPVV